MSVSGEFQRARSVPSYLLCRDSVGTNEHSRCEETFNVDGIITDRADLLRDVLIARGEWRI